MNVQVVATMHDITDESDYLTLSYEVVNGVPCVTFGIKNEGARAYATIPVKDVFHMLQVFDDVRYAQEKSS